MTGTDLLIYKHKVGSYSMLMSYGIQELEWNCKSLSAIGLKLTETAPCKQEKSPNLFTISVPDMEKYVKKLSQ